MHPANPFAASKNAALQSVIWEPRLSNRLGTLSLSSQPLVYVDGIRVNNATGSGLAYSSGFPMSIEGSAPSIVSVNYQSSLYSPAGRDFMKAAGREFPIVLLLEDLQQPPLRQGPSQSTHVPLDTMEGHRPGMPNVLAVLVPWDWALGFAAWFVVNFQIGHWVSSSQWNSASMPLASTRFTVRTDA